jgi:hypothetical protein
MPIDTPERTFVRIRRTICVGVEIAARREDQDFVAAEARYSCAMRSFTSEW